MTPEKILEVMRGREWQKAKWMCEALLRKNGVSRVERLSGSTKALVPVSAADLPTLLDMLLETQTPTGPLVGDTSRSSLRKAAEYLRKSSGTNSEGGHKQEPAAPSSTPSVKPLPSNRKYWPGEAKDVFWSLVKQLNKYDKEHAAQGQRSPLQLLVAEEATRRWWNLEKEVTYEPTEKDQRDMAMVCSALGADRAEVVPGKALR